MTTASAERLTTINRQEKAALIWAIADKLVGVYKPHEYGNVILPMCVIKRFEDTLAPTRQAVWDKEKELKDGGMTDDVLRSPFLCRAAKQQFYNTGIATYIWVISKTKDESRRGKVQLIDASQCFEKRRKSLGNKRVEITDRCRELITRAYREFANWEYVDGDLRVESRVKDNGDFKYSKVFTYRPLRLSYDHIEYSEQRAEELGIKAADRELLKQIVEAWRDHIPPHVTLPDVSFFIELGKLKIKVPASKIALVRNFFGRKDPTQMEAYIKPTDPKSGPAPDPELKDSEIIPWKQDIDEFIDANVRPYAPDFWYVPAENKIGYEIPFTREFYRYTAPKSADEIFKNFVALGEREQELMAKIIGGKE